MYLYNPLSGHIIKSMKILKQNMRSRVGRASPVRMIRHTISTVTLAQHVYIIIALLGTLHIEKRKLDIALTR